MDNRLNQSRKQSISFDKSTFTASFRKPLLSWSPILMAFGLTIIGRIGATALILVNKS